MKKGVLVTNRGTEPTPIFLIGVSQPIIVPFLDGFTFDAAGG